MAWWQIILLIIRYGPTVYKLVKYIIDLIKDISDKLHPDEAASFEKLEKQKLNMAIDYYRRNKDKRKLLVQRKALLIKRSELA